MIRILDLIEELRSVPDRLELEIAQKKFLSAHSTLSNALRTIDNEDLTLVEGLQPLQSYLSTQESSLFSILIEELSNHLYLKSPYCDTRWSAYSQGRDEVSSIEQLIEDKVKFDMSEESLSFSGSALLDDFLNNFDGSVPLSAENHISEENSFNYIRLVVETLGELNKLPSAFDLLQQRLPLELSKLIDKTVSEVRQSAPKSAVLDIGQDPGSKIPKDLFSEFETPDNEARLTVLKDLAWTLYSKFIAILQGHRVVYEVVAGISSRLSGGRNQQGLLSYDYFVFLSAIQGEIVSLMKSYISTKKRITIDSSTSKPTFKRQMSVSKNQTKTRLVLKFGNSDPDNIEIKNQYRLLKKKLESTVPGLVMNQNGDDLLIKRGVLSPYAPTDLSSSHSLLIAPNILNIRALLEPTVVFLQRAKVIHPYADRKQQQTLTSSSNLFLDDFLLNSYLPQLEESLKTSFQHIIHDPQSLQVDPHWPKFAKKPIFRSATDFVRLIKMACKLLNTGYMFREKYALLLISAIGWLKNFYSSHYKEVVEPQSEDLATPSSPVTKKLPGTLAEDETVRGLAHKIMHSIPQTPDSDQSIKQEITIFLSKRYGAKTKTHKDDQGKEDRGKDDKLKEQERVKQTDLLDVNNYRYISLMATSLRWIALELEKMRKVEELDTEPDDNASNESSTSNLRTRIKKRWTLLEANQVGQSYTQDTEYLTLTGKCLEDFDKSLKDLVKLAESCVFALRFDLRFRCVYFIDRTMLEGDYNPDNDVEERDSFIGLLDANIVSCDEAIEEVLVRKDRDTVIRGLAKLINELLIQGAENLKLINSHGVTKMYCNILVLQQMFKSIAVDPKDVDFTRALTFYNHLRQSPGVLMDRILKGDTNIDSDESKILCRLLYHEIINKHELANRREAASQARKAMKDQLVLIHQHFWSSDKVSGAKR